MWNNKANYIREYYVDLYEGFKTRQIKTVDNKIIKEIQVLNDYSTKLFAKYNCTLNRIEPQWREQYKNIISRQHETNPFREGIVKHIDETFNIFKFLIMIGMTWSFTLRLSEREIEHWHDPDYYDDVHQLLVMFCNDVSTRIFSEQYENLTILNKNLKLLGFNPAKYIKMEAIEDSTLLSFYQMYNIIN